MEDQIKLTEEEITSIDKLRESILLNIETIGRLNIQKHIISKNLDSINSELDVILSESIILDEKEKVKINEIVDKYGEGRLDFKTGVYYKS